LVERIVLKARLASSTTSAEAMYAHDIAKTHGGTMAMLPIVTEDVDHEELAQAFKGPFETFFVRIRHEFGLWQLDLTLEFGDHLGFVVTILPLESEEVFGIAGRIR